MEQSRKKQVAAPKARTEDRFGPPRSIASVPPHERIAELAYQLWQASGCPHGQDQDHWFRAERELRTARPAAR
jgi:hypothetical protein